MIELPPRIAALPRDRHGRPVPHVVRWTSEADTSRQTAAPCPLVGGMRALFDPGEQGVGEPDFGHMSVVRCRRAIVLLRCQVCDRRIKRGHGWLVYERTCVDRITTPGPLRGKVAFVEPWLCWPCVEVAAQLCPALIRRGLNHEEQRLAVLRPATWDITVHKGSHDDLPDSVRDPVVLWCSIVPGEVAESRWVPVRRREGDGEAASTGAAS